MNNDTKTTEDNKAVVKNYPLDFLIIGPQEDDQLGIMLQGSREDAEYFAFDKNATLSDLQRKVTEWNKMGSGKIDIGQHITNQYTGYVLADRPNAFLANNVAQSTTVKSGQPLSINAEAYDNYFYVWQGKVSVVERNKIQKEFTQRIPDIVKSLEQDDPNQITQHLDPVVNMSVAATKTFEKRIRQIRIARVIFAALAIVLLFAYLQFR